MWKTVLHGVRWSLGRAVERQCMDLTMHGPAVISSCFVMQRLRNMGTTHIPAQGQTAFGSRCSEDKGAFIRVI
jgi:hypothetical protein